MQEAANKLKVPAPTEASAEDMVSNPSAAAVESFAQGLKDAKDQSTALQWLNKKINPFRVSASDFGSSFQNPLMLSALVKSFDSSAIDLTKVTDDRAVGAVEEAMTIAESNLDVVRTIGIVTCNCNVATISTANYTA